MFANVPLKTFPTGKEVHDDVTRHILSSADVGNDCAKTFVEKGLVKQEMSIFHKITRSKLNTGIKNLPKKPKPVGTLKEDTQGFGILSEKNVPHNEGF